MIKTIDDIPNNEVGRYLSCAIGVLMRAEEIINKKEGICSEDILAALNKAMEGKVAIETPPACARVDLMVAALEDEIVVVLRDEDIYFNEGIYAAIKAIKEFKGVEV